jgi:branched-chain amino acid transport system permease protein
MKNKLEVVSEKFEEGSNKLDIYTEKLNRMKESLKFWFKTFRAKAAILALILLTIIPIMTQNPYYLGIFITPMIFTIFAASWDFIAGYSGQISFGHSIFFGAAGYVLVKLMIETNLPWTVALLIAGLVAVGVGVLIGIPCVRLKGPYLALATMVMLLIVNNLFKLEIFTNFFDLGGTTGLQGASRISKDPVVNYYGNFIITIICVISLLLLAKSNFGTILESIRDDDKGAKASGINVSRYKIYAFMISSFFAGIAGGLYSMHIYSVTPDCFSTTFSFLTIVFASLGGLGTIVGAGLGAFVFYLSDEILSEFASIVGIPDLTLLIVSVVLILIIRFANRGLLKPLLENLKDLWDLLIGK